VYTQWDGDNHWPFPGAPTSITLHCITSGSAILLIFIAWSIMNFLGKYYETQLGFSTDPAGLIESKVLYFESRLIVFYKGFTNPGATMPRY
jgi:hypothetical protein